MNRGYKRFVNKVLHNFQNFWQIMQNSVGITLKISVILKVKVLVKRFNNYYKKIYESMLKSFVEIEFEICNIYKAQCPEENSLFKFTEQFCKIFIVMNAQLIENTLETWNEPTSQIARFQHSRILGRSISTFENTGTMYSCRIISSRNFTELCSKFS